ncbi:dihydroxyacetone kinase subunit DhaL [Methylophaga sp. OBS4]|uniref:dihydroxyacetone kinase subunit DhaL n=1 Tax=Methylophaga sp. OBS4 TaxID=2991935 RepID=UPI002257455A|nr:dihydroxyacetone kinase subunit DhaL [Methylophaga sp. OBS4]MCX4187338.1 dihydroxyacetone kinase subunit DhaL [Methylophaga sp. OBS4]
MSTTTHSLPELITAVKKAINDNADEVAELDKAIGDGDHVINLQRGLDAVSKLEDELKTSDWSAALMKVGMTLMSTMGGASGSLFGSMFISMSKTAKDKTMDLEGVAEIFNAGVESVKARGKADIGEKTMLDTLIPATNSLKEDVAAGTSLETALENMKQAATAGMESTRDMLATKGRASFLGDRARGHIDAGARTSQLVLCAIADFYLDK